MRRILFALLFISSLFACTSNSENDFNLDIAKSINTFIGTEGYGNAFPGAALPFSMLQVSPENGWSPYYDYEKAQLIGFSHFHSVGTSQMPNLIVMSSSKRAVNDTTGGGRSFMQGFLTPYAHVYEQATPGYYALNLEKEGIFTEVTLKNRVALHGYLFSKNDSANILLDLSWSFSSNTNLDSYLFVEDDSSTVVGYRSVKGNLPQRKMYFAAKFSKKIDRVELFSNGRKVFNGKEANSKYITGAFYFPNADKNPILLKVAFSSISEENALANLNAELDNWFFEEVKVEAYNRWNEELKKIKIQTNNIQTVTNFYSALYRTLLAPNIFNDADGRYMNAIGEITKADTTLLHNIDFENSFSSIFPLFNLINIHNTTASIRSALAYQSISLSGTLPGFLNWGKDMAPNSTLYSAPAISTAWLTGIDNYNGLQALNSYKNVFAGNHPLGKFYKDDVIPIEASENALLKTMDNTYNAWSVAQLGKNFNDSSTFQFYINKSLAYQKLFDASSSRFVAVNEQGNFFSDTTKKSNPLYALQFLPLHALDSLRDYFGSNLKLEVKLDSLYAPIINQTEREDLLSIINLPENNFLFRAAYLYNRIGKPEKTQKLVKTLLNDFFKPSPNGLPTNDTSGSLSAWYIFSCLGIFPLDPVSGIYEIGSPNINQAQIELSNGNTLIVKVLNQSEKNVFVQSVSLNNQKISNHQVSYAELMNGGELVFEMTNNKQLAIKK